MHIIPVWSHLLPWPHLSPPSYHPSWTPGSHPSLLPPLCSSPCANAAIRGSLLETYKTRSQTLYWTTTTSGTKAKMHKVRSTGIKVTTANSLYHHAFLVTSCSFYTHPYSALSAMDLSRCSSLPSKIFPPCPLKALHHDKQNCLHLCHSRARECGLGPVALVSPESLLEMQNLPCPSRAYRIRICTLLRAFKAWMQH